jgi:hypothetical protein
MWTLIHVENYEKELSMREQEKGDPQSQGEVEMQNYLKQPHPAQILGIMRIMGIGYSPGEF